MGNSPLHNRDTLLSHWLPSLPDDERAAMLDAWRNHRSCADCKHWETDDGTDGACDCPSRQVPGAALLCPADYTCPDWSAKS